MATPLREPARGSRWLLTALWMGYVPAWLLVVSVTVPSVPIVLAATALWALLLLRVAVGLRRTPCPRCAGRYYGRDLFVLLGADACASCGR